MGPTGTVFVCCFVILTTPAKKKNIVLDFLLANWQRRHHMCSFFVLDNEQGQPVLPENLSAIYNSGVSQTSSCLHYASYICELLSWFTVTTG